MGTEGTYNEALGLAVSGTTAYLAGGSWGVQIIDVSVPTSPVIVSTVPTPYAEDIDVEGTHIYFTDDRAGFLDAYDVSEPAHPVYRGSVDRLGLDALHERRRGGVALLSASIRRAS